MKKVFFSFRKFFALSAVVIIAGGLLSACNKKDGVATRIPAAGLMVFNLAPDKEAVGVALSGNIVNNVPLSYTSFNGTYQNIYTGTRSIEAFDMQDSVFATSSYNFEDNNYYSVFITGNNGVYKALAVKDAIDSNATADKAYIRYINAIPDSSAPVVTVTAGATNVANGAAAFNTVSEFVPVAAGDVKIAVSNGNMITADRTVTLEKGKVYTALLVGIPGTTDSAKRVQIKYITNGGVPAEEQK